MDQKEFDQLLKRYLQGDVSESERALIDRWYQAIEHSAEKVTWRENDARFKRLRSALKTQRDAPPADAFVHRVPWLLPMAASIAVIVVLAIAGCFLRDSENLRSIVQVGDTGWQEVENTSSRTRLITLADGSEIALARGAVLKYPSRFSTDHREVTLISGVAFFEIMRDEARPFFVYSNGIVTRVLGTSFTINSDEKGNVMVDVRSGRVSVATRPVEGKDSGSSEVILTPNERATYDANRHQIVRMLVEKPQVVLPPEQIRSMSFDSAPMASVLHAVEKAYNVRITFDVEKFSSCVLTTHLIPEEDLHTRLRIVCEAIGANYSVEDGRIVIYGDGC